MNIIEQGCKDIENPKCVYVLLASDNTVKVGVTKDFELRKRVVQNQSGKLVKKSYSTEICSNAYEIENEVKKTLLPKRLCEEWYTEDYDRR